MCVSVSIGDIRAQPTFTGGGETPGSVCIWGAREGAKVCITFVDVDVDVEVDVGKQPADFIVISFFRLSDCTFLIAAANDFREIGVLNLWKRNQSRINSSPVS